MTESIKEALEYTVDLYRNKLNIIKSGNGKEYFNAHDVRLEEVDPKRYPKPISLYTLSSLVDYLKSGLDGLDNQKLIIKVNNYDKVEVATEVDELAHRTCLVTVTAGMPPISFGHWQDQEEFNIMLQSLFLDKNDRAVVLDFASHLKIEKGTEIQDNGISQLATVRDGVASLSKAKAPNPVTLTPYRTFNEVEQPSSQFVFRINNQACLALFEADGGKWKLDAINNIANYLKTELADKENITILA